MQNYTIDDFRHHNHGFTLMEIIIGLGLSAMLLLFVSSSFVTDSRYRSRVAMGENFERLEIAMDGQLFGNKFLHTVVDDEVKKCLENPCAQACNRNSKWKDVSVLDIPIIKYKPTPESDELNDGGYYEATQFNRCEPLPREPLERIDAKPRYPASCQINLKSQGRFRANGSYEIRIFFAHAGSAMTHMLFRKATYTNGDIVQVCPEAKAMYCHSRDAFILRVDPEKEELACANPESEVNYDD